MATSRPNIFEYLDFKVFLNDMFHYFKSTQSKFSYRFFAKKAGYTSSGYYSNVVKGVHSMSESYAHMFAKALELNGAEKEYFLDLIDFNQTDVVDHKQNLLNCLIQRMPTNQKRLAKAQRSYYQRWYYPVLHQALHVFDCDGENLTELAQFIRPVISEAQAKESLKLLQQLELVKLDESGFYRPMDKSYFGGKEVGPLSIRKFQKDLLKKAIESIDEVPPHQRMMLSSTFVSSEKTNDLIKNLLVELQRQCVSLGSQTKEDRDRLMNLNLSFFPLSQGGENE